MADWTPARDFFLVVDDDIVVLPQDHPFAPGGRFASLLIRDPDLAEGLAIGFDGLWKKAMKDLQEISFQPVPPAPSGTSGQRSKSFARLA